MSTLPDATHLGSVTLAVADLSRAVNFYSQTLGIPVISQSDHSASLGVDGKPLVVLNEKEGAKRPPRHSTGLYHAAILLPTRADLGRLITHLAEIKVPMSGYADHLVSEAFYLNDPDGNGLELYRDRPRNEWPMDGDLVQMENAPINFDEFFADAEREGKPWTGMPTGTTLGHMHLKIGNDKDAQAFYTDVVGFSVMAYYPSAVFVSAGGYHHHLGLNMWESRGAGAPPADSVGLQEWSIVVPDANALNAAAERLTNAGALIERGDDFALFADPWGTRARINVG
jgi:catechol 2,3-dioxygenase